MPLSRIKGVVVIFGLKIGDRTGYGVYGTLIQEIEAALRAQVPHAHRTHMLKFLGLVWGEEGLLVFYHMHYQMAPRKLVRVISNYFKRAHIFNEIARLPFNARDHLQVQERIGVYTRAGGRGGVCDYMPNIRWEKALPSTRSKKVLAPVAKYSSDSEMEDDGSEDSGGQPWGGGWGKCDNSSDDDDTDVITPAGVAVTNAAAFGVPAPPLAFGVPFAATAFGIPAVAAAFNVPAAPSAFGASAGAPAFDVPAAPSTFGASAVGPVFNVPAAPSAFGASAVGPAFDVPAAPSAFGALTVAAAFGAPAAPSAFSVAATNAGAFGVPAASAAAGYPPPADEDGIDMLAGAAMGLDRLAASDAAVYGGDIDDLFSIDDNDPLFRRDLLDDPLFNNFPLLRDLSLGSSDDNGSPNPCSFDAAPEESAQPDALSFVIAADVEVQMPTARATAATMAAVRHGTSTAPIVFDRLINNNRATPVVTAMDVEADAGTGRAPAPGEVMEAVTHAQGPEQVPDEAEAGGGGGGGGEATGAAGVHAPEEAPEEAAAEAAGGVQAGSNRMPMTGADMDAEMLAMLGVTRAMVNHRVR
ncbi:hypothetical protein JKP88DRAFT_241289 [Tribonema minus]|uniref:Uncharacterized protein n=1 Tax=Tribonema minus TaxID=303371 RepID=A0A835Z6A8_9STRA|nr:hypothetical protein JKP88DRAFT_241289 [Tribonema minus]